MGKNTTAYVSADFVLQGFTSRKYADIIRWLFDIKDIHSALLGVAFVQEDGVRMIEKSMKKCAEISFFVGVRNHHTTYQGLARLLKLKASLFVVDTGSKKFIFHPKIYLTRNKTRARLVVGSGNLTLGGMNNNIEAGIAIEFNLESGEHRRFVSFIEGHFFKLPARYPKNVTQIKGLTELNHLWSRHLLADEKEIRAAHSGPLSSIKPSSADFAPVMKLNVPHIHHHTKDVPPDDESAKDTIHILPF